MIPDPASFRDRENRVYREGNRVVRGLSASAVDDWRAFNETGLYGSLLESGDVVRTWPVEEGARPEALAAAGWAGALEHELVPFVSYPFEWTFGMLREAALLHVRSLREALRRGLVLKDATPYNVQFVGSRPVFIDTPSFTRYRAGDPWFGYRQFCSQLFYPLLLEAARGIPAGVLLRGQLEGVDPRTCRSALSFRDFFRRGVPTHVVLHAAAEASFSGTRLNVRSTVADAGFSKELILRNVESLGRAVEALRPRVRTSAWSGYRERNSYEPEARAAKAAFVAEALARVGAASVWDVGANTGEYSRIASQSGAYVVAMDADREAVERLWQELRREECRNILPLVVNVADPSPGLGWRGRERPPLWDRGRPDVVLALALVHHLVLGANLDLADVVKWLSGLGKVLVIEFVAKSDPMSEQLLRNRDDQFPDYGRDGFENLLARCGRIVRRLELPGGHRVLYECATADAGKV